MFWMYQLNWYENIQMNCVPHPKWFGSTNCFGRENTNDLGVPIDLVWKTYKWFGCPNWIGTKKHKWFGVPNDLVQKTQMIWVYQLNWYENIQMIWVYQLIWYEKTHMIWCTNWIGTKTYKWIGVPNHLVGKTQIIWVYQLIWYEKTQVIWGIKWFGAKTYKWIVYHTPNDLGVPIELVRKNTNKLGAVPQMIWRDRSRCLLVQFNWTKRQMNWVAIL